MESIEMFDEQFARKLQEEYDREVAIQLQDHNDEENEKDIANVYADNNRRNIKTSLPTNSESDFLASDVSPVDSSLEHSDPNPDIRILFLQFNTQFFWGKLSGIEVKWSPRMTLCAGLCVYEGHGGLCSVRLSLPLLKLRPRKDLVETLLHEMIHAYLFVTHNDRDHDGHGPQFQGHMHRINKATGANISVYHTFHDEVASYQQHWWRCDGPCQSRQPYFGYVKRAMNRAPSFRDFWWAEHQATCGGTYTKIKEPEGYGQKKVGKKDQAGKSKSKDIRSFGGKGHVLGSTSSKTSSNHNPDNRSNVGSSRNPATIFNMKKNNEKNRTNNVSAPSTSTSANSQSSIIVNGILKRKTGNVNSSLFSVVNNDSTISAYENSKPDEIGISFPKREASKPRTRLESLDNDDDDLWASDINNIESVPLSALLKGKNLKGKTEIVNSGKSKANDLFKRNDTDAFKSNNKKPWFSVKSTKNQRRKPSVCKGGEFYNDKTKKKRKKYILDELDSNDNLWDIPDLNSGLERKMKIQSHVSPFKVKIKEECHVKDEEQNDAYKICTTKVKSEKFSPSSDRNIGNDSSATNIPGNSKIKFKSEKQIKDEPKEHIDRKISQDDDFVDLTDFDDDEFDFVSSQSNLFSDVTPQDKKAGKLSPSQRSIGSFFTSSGKKQSKKRNSLFSNVNSHTSKSDASSCSKGKDGNSVNDELPDISDSDFKYGIYNDNKPSDEPFVYDVDVSDDDFESSRLDSKKKQSKTDPSSLTKSKKTSSSSAGNIRNYLSNSSTSSSKGRSIFTSLGNSGRREKGKSKKKMVIHDLSDSTDDDEIDFVGGNTDTSEDLEEEEDFTKACDKNKKRSSDDAFAPVNESFSEDSDKNEEGDNDLQGLPFKRRKHSENVEDSSCGSVASSTGEQVENPEESDSSQSGNKVACPVCSVFVSQADINSHLDSCLQ